MQLYVVENAIHGVYTGIDWSQSGNSYGPRFSWSIPRSDGQPFFTLADAKEAVARLKTFKHYAWKRPSWIDDIYIFDLTHLTIVT